MIGPFFPDLGSSNLMKSEIVRKEKDNLERDYAELTQLGQRYEVRFCSPFPNARLFCVDLHAPHADLHVAAC